VIARIRTAARRALVPVRHPPVIDPVLWQITRVVLLPVMYGPLRARRTNHRVVPRRGPVIVACNHVSVADPPLVAAACRPRRVWLMAKEELFGAAPLAWWMSRSGAFPVRRNSADTGSVRTARELLARGECLVLFPEGGVTRDGTLRPGFPGIGSLALMRDVTVVPAVVWNTQLARGPVRVHFGAPVPMRDLRDGPRAGRNRRATERIMDHIAALLPLAGGPVQDGPRGEPYIPPPRAAGGAAVRG
jgi:1-acyl-sn-glycerol-3-phosphate acyltransferase